MSRGVFGAALSAMMATSISAWGASTGTVEGTTTTLDGTALNGMCGVLYNAKGTKELVDFAGTGTDGTPGHYIQTNVMTGTYRLLFVNCGANTNGQGPDFNYVPIFYGSTWTLKKVPKIVVSAGQTTSLGSQPIPRGGAVIGTVTDKTTKTGADTPPVMMVPPGGSKFFLRFSWTLVCGDSTGAYNSNTYFQQGVPDGATIYFAPGGWGCTNSQGQFNDGEWAPKKSKPVSIVEGGVVTVNGAIRETGALRR